MGIQGLLPFLKDATEAINIRKYKGHVVAVDTYCWIHRGAVACAVQLAKGEKCDQYVRYCLKFVNMLRSMDITPVLVFDGQHLPAKQSVEETRRKRREMFSQKGRQLLREGKASEARDAFVKCINVTSEMALEVMKAVRSLEVDCIVAPYEADAQLAYLEKNGYVQAIITEDSDLLAFGCKRVIFKMDSAGNALEIDQSRLNKAVKMGNYFSVEKFRHMCILAGCDYLASLTGIGLGKARKFIHTSTSPDIRNVLKRIPLQLKLKVPVTEEYIDGFIRADHTFLYQLAFDPQKKKLMPLNPYPPELAETDMDYAGRYLDSKLAMEVALGNIELNTMKKTFDFTPEFRKQYPRGTPRHKFSIWHDGYRPAPPLVNAGRGDIVRQPTKGQEVIVPSNGIKKKKSPKKRRRDEESHNNEDPADISSLYSEAPDAKMARVDEIGVIPETPSPLKNESSSPMQESRSASQSKPRMIPRNMFAVKKVHRVDSATRRDMLNSDVTVSSRFFKTAPKPEPCAEESETGPKTENTDDKELLDISNHEGRDHIYSPKKVEAPDDHKQEGPEMADCIRDHQRKVRAMTGRLCNKKVDRTCLLDSLQKFKHSGFTEYYEEQIRLKKKSELARENEERKMKQLLTPTSQGSTKLSRRSKQGAFSWSTKKSLGLQKTLTDSVKGLSSFHRTKNRSPVIKWSDEGNLEESEDRPKSQESITQASQDMSENKASDSLDSQQTNLSSQQSNINSQESNLDLQHDSQQSDMLCNVPSSQRSLADCSIDPDGPTFSQIVQKREGLPSDNTSDLVSKISVSQCDGTIAQEQKRPEESPATKNSSRFKGSNARSTPEDHTTVQGSGSPAGRNPFKVSKMKLRRGKGTIVCGDEVRSSPPARQNSNPFKMSKVELSPSDNELCGFLTDIANDESFSSEVAEQSKEDDGTPDRAALDFEQDSKEECDTDWNSTSKTLSDEDDDVSIVSVTTSVKKKLLCGGARTPALPSLGARIGRVKSDENNPPGKRRPARRDGEKVSSYFTKSKETSIKAEGTCKVPGLSKKRKPASQNPSNGQQPTLMAFIKKKTTPMSDDREKRPPLSPTKLDDNVTPESESMQIFSKSLTARKAIFS